MAANEEQPRSIKGLDFYMSDLLSSTGGPLLPSRLNNRRQLLNRPRVPRHGVALAMVKHHGGVFIAHAVERHGAVDVWVVAADDVARGHVDDVLAFVGEEALH